MTSMKQLKTLTLICLLFNLCLCGVLARPLGDSYDGQMYDGYDDYKTEYTYETDNGEKYACPGGELSIEIALLCDGFSDCHDGTDENEETCRAYGRATTETVVPLLKPVTTEPDDEFDIDYSDYADCSMDEFQCPSEAGLCLPVKSVCDGVSDCPDGEDEADCGDAASNHYDANGFKSIFPDTDIRPPTYQPDLRMVSPTQAPPSISNDDSVLAVTSSHQDNVLSRLINNGREHTGRDNRDGSPLDFGPYILYIQKLQSDTEAATSTPQTTTMPTTMPRLVFRTQTPTAQRLMPVEEAHNEKAGMEQVVRYWPERISENNPTIEERLTGESGETIAADHFPDVQSLSDEEAENFLQDVAGLSDGVDEVDHESQIPADTRTGIPSTVATTTVQPPASTTRRSKVESASAQSPKKKVKGLLHQLLRHVAPHVRSVQILTTPDAKMESTTTHVTTVATQPSTTSTETETTASVTTDTTTIIDTSTAVHSSETMGHLLTHSTATTHDLTEKSTGTTGYLDEPSTDATVVQSTIPTETTAGLEVSSCNAGYEFQCRTSPGDCVPRPLLCDGFHDCADGSDEVECGCGENEFQCVSGTCVSATYRCDGYNDCGDYSDEIVGCAFLPAVGQERPTTADTRPMETTVATVLTTSSHLQTPTRNPLTNGKCAKEQNVCNLNICRNGAACYLKDDCDFVCVCTQGFHGTLCHIEDDCQPGTTCDVGNSSSKLEAHLNALIFSSLSLFLLLIGLSL